MPAIKAKYATRPVRNLAVLCAAALLAGCAVAPPGSDASRAAECRARFQAYDSAALLEPEFTMGVLQPVPRTGGLLNSRTAAESALLQFGCTTTPAEMPDLAGRDLSAFARRPADNQAPRRYLHVAAVTSNQSEAVLRQLYQDLGYPVRVKGAGRLGRRVFVGPLGTTPEQQSALGLAQALGFESAYFLTRVP